MAPGPAYTKPPWPSPAGWTRPGRRWFRAASFLAHQVSTTPCPPGQKRVDGVPPSPSQSASRCRSMIPGPLDNVTWRWAVTASRAKRRCESRRHQAADASHSDSGKQTPHHATKAGENRPWCYASQRLVNCSEARRPDTDLVTGRKLCLSSTADRVSTRISPELSHQTAHAIAAVPGTASHPEGE